MFSLRLTLLEGVSMIEIIISFLVFGLLTWMIWYKMQQSQKHSLDTEELSRDELQKRVAAAAASRLIKSTTNQNTKKIKRNEKKNNNRKLSKSTKKKDNSQKNLPNDDSQGTNEDNEKKGTAKPRDPYKKKEHVQKVSSLLSKTVQDFSEKSRVCAIDSKNENENQSAKKDVNAEYSNIRKATQVDQIKWNEERISQEQFGFSVYGHEAAASCCATKPMSSSNINYPPAERSSFGKGVHSISEIQHLPGNDVALSLLQQLAREFEPVLQKRGWAVLALTEMCCCGDGDEHLNVNERTSSQTSLSSGGDTLGYCVSHNDNRIALGIHVRLRPPRSCKSPFSSFYPYNDLVVTMAHELAHIAIGPHTNEFFQLMKEIENERAHCITNGLILGEDGFPLVLGSGRRLGTTKKRSRAANFAIGSKELKKRVAKAAAARHDGHQEQKQELRDPKEQDQNQTELVAKTSRHDSNASIESIQNSCCGRCDKEITPDFNIQQEIVSTEEGWI